MHCSYPPSHHNPSGPATPTQVSRNTDEDNFLRTMDVEFKCGEQRFLAHQFVLAQCSNIFREAFDHASQVVKASHYKGHPQPLDFSVDGVLPAAFKILLDFCYTGTATLQDPTVVEHLMALAKYYQISSLLGLCQDFFKRQAQACSPRHDSAVPQTRQDCARPRWHRSEDTSAHSDRKLPRLPSISEVLGNITDEKAPHTMHLPIFNEDPTVPRAVDASPSLNIHPGESTNLPLALPPLRPTTNTNPPAQDPEIDRHLHIRQTSPANLHRHRHSVIDVEEKDKHREVIVLDPPPPSQQQLQQQQQHHSNDADLAYHTGYCSSLSPPTSGSSSPVLSSSSSPGPLVSNDSRRGRSSPPPIRYHYYEPDRQQQQLQHHHLQQQQLLQQQQPTRFAIVEERHHVREREEDAWRFVCHPVNGGYPRHHSAPLAPSTPIVASVDHRRHHHAHSHPDIGETTAQRSPSSTTVSSPYAAESTADDDTANCHHCKTKKVLWIRCPRIRTHRFCDRCVERHFMMRFERAVSLCDSGHLWKTGCPVCKLTCPCASCARKRGKITRTDKPRNTSISKKTKSHKHNNNNNNNNKTKKTLRQNTNDVGEDSFSGDVSLTLSVP